MKVRLIAIGNSRGIRIPKSVLEQCGLTEEIDLKVQANQLVIRSPRTARRGWDAAFAKMRARGDDRLMDVGAGGVASEWDRTEWKW
jgi:antitoxin MazE